jgi:hypothetical protein
VRHHRGIVVHTSHRARGGTRGDIVLVRKDPVFLPVTDSFIRYLRANASDVVVVAAKRIVKAPSR